MPTSDVTALDRSVGALVGLATGDAVGTTLEFAAPGSFAPLDDMVGGGPFSLEAGAFTDDTSMALCLAESLLDCGGMQLADQLRRYVQWWRHGYLSSTGACFDIGVTTVTQLRRFVKSGEAVDPHPNPEAAANGSLMRLAPVPIRWHRDVEAAIDASAESSRTTHAADRPVDTCKVLGGTVAALIGGESWETATDAARWGRHALHPAVAAFATGSWRHKEPPAIRGSGYCIDALEAALWAVEGAGDFREAVLRAANLGDDADTTAAITGQIAGARWGHSGIPASWRSRLVLGGRIRSLATWLHAAMGERDDEERWPFDDVVHAWWVRPGSVLAGEYPGALDAGKARQKLDVLVDAGIRTFIDLTTSDDGLAPYGALLAEVAAARGLDLQRQNFPIPDVSVIADDGYTPITAAIEDARTRGGVYVHCWGGVGRTGTVVGCLLAEEGLSYDEIVTRISHLRQGTVKAARRAPETAEQSEVIRRRVQARGR